MIVGYYDDPKYGSSSHSERLDRYYSMDIFLNFFLQRKEYMLASKEEQLAFKGHPAFYGDSYAKGGKTHIMPDGSKMLDSDHYAKGGTIEERVYAIDKRNFRSKNLLNTLDDEKFMQIAENKGLVWSSMDKFLDSNEYNEEGDNLNFREIPVKMMVAKEYVNPDFL
jgi:hypothetical protein